MAKFKVNYIDFNEVDEEIEADEYVDEGDWIDFVRYESSVTGPITHQIARLRSNTVQRIDRISD